MSNDEPTKNLAQQIGDLAIELQQHTGTQATLRAIVEGALDLVPGACWAGISRIEGRTVCAEVPTDRLVKELDELQSSLNEGPCLSALRQHRTVHVSDMTTETRWPQFTRAAVQRGVHASLSFQLFVNGENLGALNLYADRPNAFNDESELIGSVLAQHASIAIVGAEAETQFDAALASRDVIGQAKGILMHWMGLTGLDAFRLLTRLSQTSNSKLVDIARHLVDKHEAELDRPNK